MTRVTYREAGVDIEAGDALVEAIKPLAKAAPSAPKQPAAGFAAKWATTWRGRIADPDVRAATLAAQWAAPANKTALDKATAEDPALAAAVGAEVAAAIDAEADA